MSACWATAHSRNSARNRTGTSGSGATASPDAAWPIASTSSDSFDPKVRKMVTSLIPAASAMPRVVVPRQPCSA